MKTLKSIETKSAPSGPGSNSSGSPSERPSATIESFVGFVAAGVGGFLEAGKQLVELHEKDAGVFAKIIRHAPWITMDMLMTLLRVGRREIHPALLLYSGRKVFDRLAALPYERQETVVNNPVEMGKLMQQSAKQIRVENRRVAADWHQKVSGPSQIDGHHLLTERTAARMGGPTMAVKPAEAPVTKEHGLYMIVLKTGKNPQFFKRTGAPINAQRVRLDPDPDDPAAMVANLELYEFKR